eukprot:377605-Rhodomonas_salina.4
MHENAASGYQDSTVSHVIGTWARLELVFRAPRPARAYDAGCGIRSEIPLVAHTSFNARCPALARRLHRTACTLLWIRHGSSVAVAVGGADDARRALVAVVAGAAQA